MKRAACLAIVLSAALLAFGGCDNDEEAGLPEESESPETPLKLRDAPQPEFRTGQRAVGLGVNSAQQRVYVAWAESNGGITIGVIDSSTGKEIASIPLTATSDYLNELETNPTNGMLYAVDSLVSTLSIVDGSANRLVATIPGGERGPSQSVAVDEQTNRIYWGNEQKGISVMDGSSGELLDTISFGPNQRIFDTEINSRTNRLYATGTEDVFVVDLDDYSVVGKVKISGGMWLAINPETNRIYASSYTTNDITVIDGETSTQIGTISPSGDFEEYTGYIAVDPLSNRLYLTNTANNTVDIVDGSTNHIVDTISAGTRPMVLAFEEDTGRLFVLDFGELTNYQGKVLVIERD